MCETQGYLKNRTRALHPCEDDCQGHWDLQWSGKLKLSDCLSFQDILLEIKKKKNYKLMIFCCWVIFLAVLSAFPVDCWFDSWAVESMPFSECEGESWGWRYVPHLGTFRQGCTGPPASPQMSRDQDECLVWLMKFGLFTAPQSHSYPCQLLGQMEYWEWNVGREFRFFTWFLASLIRCLTRDASFGP